ncbi:hypothetical protein DFQ28_006861 [Apophysomyces sp. BC1034]|nr:hypothetical protein DFQ29_005707 [Apophysomyces sp. BC1021]KAG0187097.1 hypothetical protein DFQ28_006861 [Apophysomyces sp. BC1034]
MHIFPKSVLQISSKAFFTPSADDMKAGDSEAHEPYKLPLPGTCEYVAAAETAVTVNITETNEEYQEYRLRIPRKHIILPPTAFRPTKEFKEAVHNALQLATDDKKFIELQHVFKEFGYYYPYWITIGGIFLYRWHRPLFGTLKEIITKVFERNIEWEALGGNPRLFRTDLDIDHWLATTATSQVLVKSFDVNPIYDLLESATSSEVQRIYNTQYYQFNPQVNYLMEADNTAANDLILLAQTRGKIGVTKGVHFGGSLSEEDVAELVNGTDISKLIRLVSVAGKPRIKCMARRTVLGTSSEMHAFLPDNFLDESVEDSGFVSAAKSHYIESKDGKSQPLTPEMGYFVVYMTHREAVIKALDMKSDKEKYQELQKVFGRFGYYYPSSIYLGGRLVYREIHSGLNSVWPSNDGMENIEALLMKIHPNNALKEKAYVELIGGSSTTSGYKDLIDSIRTNQVHIQYRSLRPTYELLEDKLRVQVLRVYDWSKKCTNSFPEIPKGLHFDGTEAKDQAVEIAKDKVHSRALMLRTFSSQSKVKHVKRYVKGVEITQNDLRLDIERDRTFPGSTGFVLGSEGACKERSIANPHNLPTIETAFDVGYVTCKELHLSDQYIQPTIQFKEAIDKALMVGREDQDTYKALQDVFQRFGYYYPSRIQIGIIICAECIFNCLFRNVGGRIALQVLPQHQEHQHPTQDKGFENLGEKSSEITKLESSEVVVKSDQRIAKEIVTNAIEKSLTKSDYWSSTGGDSVALLFHDVKGWIQSVESNQTVTQHGELRPIYELLDEEQRHRVQQTYENIILQDGRVCYNYLLELTNDETLEDDQNRAANICTPTQALFDKLSMQVFPDSNSAIQFCRSACADYGFSVTEKESAGRAILMSCSWSPVSDTTFHDLQDKRKHESFCSWGVTVSENGESQWQFRELGNDDGSMHNHPLTTQGTGSHYVPQSSEKPISSYSSTHTKSTLIIRLAVESPAWDRGSTDLQYLRYGDVVRLEKIGRIYNDVEFSASENINGYLEDSLQADELLELKNSMKDSGFDLLWYVSMICAMPYSPRCRKIVPSPLTRDDNEDESEIDEINSDTEKAESRSSFDEPHKTLYPLSTAIDHAPDDKDNGMDNNEYVRNDDIIMFQSQATINRTIQVYVRIRNGRLECVTAGNCADRFYKSCGHRIRQIDQYAFEKECAALRSGKVNQKYKLDLVIKHADEPVNCNRVDGSNQLLMGQAYMYGYAGLDIDNTQALKYLQLAADQGSGEAFFELGKLFWRTARYQEAVDMYKRAASFSVMSAYHELGDLYHAGFSVSHPTNNYAIIQNQRMAFMYYSIGGIFGGAKAALRVGEYYEKGLAEGFLTDWRNALRWYEYVNVEFGAAEALSAIGRIKDKLVYATTDPSEKTKLHREAYTAFAKAAMTEPYARYMTAMYNLNGWGCEQPDPVLGFHLLISLVEMGFDTALSAISKCYEEGIGVERDPAMALAYRELAAHVDVQ